jgi:FkbM family methyltransferase
VVDAGANVGYMTGILAARSGPDGRVLAFEPNPLVLPRLRANVARFSQRPGTAPIEIFPLALSDSTGTARLATPQGFGANNGIGFLTTNEVVGAATVNVETRRLDDILSSANVAVMKLDVEGHERAVLSGSDRLLASHRIRHIVFEEHMGATSETSQMLTARGYTLFQIGWQMSGPVLTRPDTPNVCRSYESPSHLATLDVECAVNACSRPGWAVFGRSP